MRVVVLGAGINGVVTGYFLARDGHDVTILDRRPAAAMEASYANGGVAGGTQVEPWAKPGMPVKMLRWIGKSDAPMLIQLGQLPSMLSWGVKFLRSCNRKTLSQTIEANIRLTRFSLESFELVRREAAIDGPSYGLARGAMKVFSTEEAYAAARVTAEALIKGGIEVQQIDRNEMVRREPSLEVRAEGLLGGLLYPMEEIGDCRAFAQLLDDRCRKQGVKFLYDTSISRLIASGGKVHSAETSRGSIQGDSFVVALGSYTTPLLRTVAVDSPIIPVKGVSITVPVRDWPQSVRSAIIDHTRMFGIMRIGEVLRVSGSAEIAGYDSTPSDARCRALIAKVVDLLPGFENCLREHQPRFWAGLRPATPDGAPVLGSTRIANLFINSGHGPQGWSTSCGSARIVADLVSGRTAPIDLHGLTLDRFAA